MAVAFVSTIPAWGVLNGGAQTSGAFTPTATNYLAVVDFEGGGSGFTLIYSGTVNTPVAIDLYNDTTNGNTFGIASKNNITGGSQTLTVNSTPGTGGRSGFAWQYSGVVTATPNKNYNTGVTTAVGVATVVPSGSILLSICIRTDNVGGNVPTPSANGGVTPTTRGSGDNGTKYAAAEYVGTGGSITPTFGSLTSGDYMVLQVLMDASAAVNVNLTGQAMTASAGTAGVTHAQALTGQAATTAQGNISSNGNVTVGLTGQAATAATGTLLPTRSLVLTGQALAVTWGALSTPQYPIAVVDTPNTTSAYRITASPDITSGNWVQASGNSSGTTSAPTGLILLSDATWEFETGNYPTNFYARVSDDFGVTWGTWALQSVGVTAAVTGQAATSAQGTAGNTHAIPTTGQAATAAAGTVAPTSALAMVGQAATVSPGTLTPARSLALTGQAATAAAGTLVPAVSIALVGLSSTATPGAIVAAIAAALSGQGAAIAQGTITTGSGNVTVGLTGQAATSAVGSLAPTAALALLGLAGTVAAGTLTPVRALALTGQASTATPGALTLAAALQLVGAALAMGQGIITTGPNVNVTLSGQAMAAALGTLTPQHVMALTGAAIVMATDTLTPQHAAALAGTLVTASPGTVATLRALALLGIPATISQGTINSGSDVTVALVGLAAAMAAGNVSPALVVTLGGVEMIASVGTTIAVLPPTGGSAAPAFTSAGAFASRNPRVAQLSGTQPSNVASIYGCILGRFAWLSERGEAANARLTPTDRLGFALMQAATWGAMYWTAGRPVLRAGNPITLISSGDVWARFDGGAFSGQQVFASRVDGSAVSGYAAACDPTPWYVVTDADPGGLAIISTWSAPPL